MMWENTDKWYLNNVYLPHLLYRKHNFILFYQNNRFKKIIYLDLSNK
jgi:hypothetical protein